MIDTSISYFGFVDLWLDVRITSEIVPKETIRVVVSNKVDFRKLELIINLQTRFVGKSFWRFFCTCALHQFVDYLNKPSFMKISGDHRRKPASSRLWPHFPLHLRQKDWNVPWVKVTSAWKKQAWHAEFVRKVSLTLVFWFKCWERKSRLNLSRRCPYFAFWNDLTRRYPGLWGWFWMLPIWNIRFVWGALHCDFCWHHHHFPSSK